MGNKNTYKNKNKGGYNKNKQKFYSKNKPQKNKQEEPLYFEASLLQMKVEDLSLRVETIALLKNNRINITADLCRRTEHDMYKIQTLNKRILTEIKAALDEHGLYFKPIEEKIIVKTNTPKEEKVLPTEKKSKFATGAAKDIIIDVEEVQKEEKKDNKITEPLLSDQWRKIQKGGKWGFYDGFKTVIPCMYDEVYGFSEGLCSVELDDKCGYIDENNNIVIDLKYELAMSFYEGLAVVSLNGKVGFIDHKGKEVIPFIYDAATHFEDGEAKVKKDGKWGTIDKENNVVWIK